MLHHLQTLVGLGPRPVASPANQSAADYIREAFCAAGLDVEEQPFATTAWEHQEVGYALNKMGKKIVHVFLEEDLKKTQQSYIAMDNNVHLAKFRRDPTIISREAAEESYNELVEGQLYLDHWGSMSPEEVMRDFRYGASWGAHFGILDHISMVFSGTETTNERKDIDMLLTDMAAFTRESRMHLIVISHIKL